jgi:hypothetical protein
MRGLDPRIHVIAGAAGARRKDVDGRNKSGHDDFWFRSKRNNRLPFPEQPCGFSGMTNNHGLFKNSF